MQTLHGKLLQRITYNQVSRCLWYSTKNLPDVGQPTAASHPQLLNEGEITPGITSEEYVSRRKRILELLPDKSLAIFAAAPVKMMTDVVPYTYRQDADYSYITGCQQPGGLAVLGHDCGLCMFMPEASQEDVLWQGQIAGVDAALHTFKAEQSYPISKLPKEFDRDCRPCQIKKTVGTASTTAYQGILQHCAPIKLSSYIVMLEGLLYCIYSCASHFSWWLQILPDMIRSSSRLFHNGKTAIQTYLDLDAFQKAVYDGRVKDLSGYTHEARLVKSPAELKLMRDSASIACQALLQTMMHSKTFPYEAMLSAKVEYECKMRGAQRMAFNPVVGGGPNGSVIHYSRNDQKINDGDLVLMDIGCELHGYVSDLTRTWPPCGRFTPVHEELYELILETNKECLNLCKPGTSIRQIHNYSVDKLRKGFKKIGILKDDRSHTYQQLNPTNIGHYLGMDVHDCSTISYDRPLKPGVVITIEPGVYIPTGFKCPERYQGIGIRIEDEVLITESGYEVLTGSLPKEIKHIESLLNNYGHAMGMDNHNAARAASS